jgi:hypothetical protein
MTGLLAWRCATTMPTTPNASASVGRYDCKQRVRAANFSLIWSKLVSEPTVAPARGSRSVHPWTVPRLQRLGSRKRNHGVGKGSLGCRRRSLRLSSLVSLPDAICPIAGIEQGDFAARHDAGVHVKRETCLEEQNDRSRRRPSSCRHHRRPVLGLLPEDRSICRANRWLN